MLKPIREIDLAGTWAFTPEGGERTTIQVPGGGWLKQGFRCEAGTYETTLVIPGALTPQVYQLELGAVNHLAEVWLGEDAEHLAKIHEEVTAFTPLTVDLTPHVRPGGRYVLRLFVRAWQNGRPIAPHWAEWSECVARGIFRSAKLLVYPEVYLADAFVRPSVAKNQVSCQVWLTNASARTRQVTLSSKLTSWNESPWRYPRLADATVTLAPGETQAVTLGPVNWGLGPASYWWPNVPYRPGFRAELHNLRLTLTERGERGHSAVVRFGFRECRQEGQVYTLNGVRVNFRGDNLQVANYDRIDRGGKGDAIDTIPGFLPPSPENPGWPQAVDNFMHLNYNCQRTHMGPWTPYMLDVCDELGLMLIGESASRWNGFDMENGRGFHEVKCLQDIIRRDRNHAAIVRWSSKNEAQSLDPAYHRELYDAIKALDDTRPVYEDLLVSDRAAWDLDKVFALVKDEPDFTWIEHYLTSDGQGGVRFSSIEHNDAVVPLADRPYGLGEGDWMRSSTPAGLVWFATTVALARGQGASDVRPYVLLSSWCSSVPGTRTADIITEEGRHPVYGEDNLPEPWEHPGIKLLQKAYHPLLAFDYDFWHVNRKGDALGHFPIVTPQFKAGESITREITVFNDEFAREDLELQWDVREGSTSCRPFAKGTVPLTIKPGAMARVPVTFTAPKFNTHVFLTLRVLKGGVERFADDQTCFEAVGGSDFRSEFNGEEREFL